MNAFTHPTGDLLAGTYIRLAVPCEVAAGRRRGLGIRWVPTATRRSWAL
jgi:hypothetical protein